MTHPALVLGLLCAAFAVAELIRKVLALQEAARAVADREASAHTVPAGSPANRQNPLLQALQRTERALRQALDTRTLLYFDLPGTLRPAERSFARSAGWLRPFAGWMLLVGIVVTLFNLQGSIGNLSTAFQQLSPPATHSASIAPPQDRERRVTEGMQHMASNAAQAFLSSLTFVLLALACMIASALLERQSRLLLGRYEAWATDLVGYHLPQHLPLADGSVADKLNQTVIGMGDVVEQLRESASALGNLAPLLTSMRDVNDSIQQTMEQLPQDLRSSMSSVTSEMVKELSGTLSESTEYTKKILAIYGEQELRVRSLNAVLKEQDKALVELRGAHAKLSVLPEQVQQLTESAGGIRAAVEQLASLQQLPEHTRTLGEAADRLAGAGTQIAASMVSGSQALQESIGQSRKNEHTLRKAGEQVAAAEGSMRRLIELNGPNRMREGHGDGG